MASIWFIRTQIHIYVPRLRKIGKKEVSKTMTKNDNFQVHWLGKLEKFCPKFYRNTFFWLPSIYQVLCKSIQFPRRHKQNRLPVSFPISAWSLQGSHWQLIDRTWWLCSERNLSAVTHHDTTSLDIWIFPAQSFSTLLHVKVIIINN